MRGVVRPYEGLTLIALRDETDAIDVAVTDDLIALSGVTPTLDVGQAVQVDAAVSLYQNEPQLVPASLDDIVRLDDVVPIATRRMVVELESDDVGTWIGVQGVVAGLDPFAEGLGLALDDGTGSITVVLWRDVCDALLDKPDGVGELARGAEIAVQGQLAEHRSELEVIPELASDVRVLAMSSADPSTVTGERIFIGALTARDVGRQVVLSGSLGWPQRFSAGVKYPLTDHTGTIVLLLWDEVYRKTPVSRSLTAGTGVDVVGEIDQFRGDLEIIPDPYGVKLLE